MGGNITHPFWELVLYSKIDTVSGEPLLLSWLVSVGMTKPPLPCGYPEVVNTYDEVFQLIWQITKIQLAQYSPLTLCMCVCVLPQFQICHDPQILSY
jgi:hypothetical protein